MTTSESTLLDWLIRVGYGGGMYALVYVVTKIFAHAKFRQTLSAKVIQKDKDWELAVFSAVSKEANNIREELRYQVKDLRDELSFLQNDNVRLSDELGKVREDYLMLKVKYDSITREHEELSERYRELEKRYNEITGSIQ